MGTKVAILLVPQTQNFLQTLGVMNSTRRVPLTWGMVVPLAEAVLALVVAVVLAVDVACSITGVDILESAYSVVDESDERGVPMPLSIVLFDPSRGFSNGLNFLSISRCVRFRWLNFKALRRSCLFRS